MTIRLKRVYDEPAAEDGFRILVERLWPRGLTKANAHIDLWLKEIAPSPALRQWYAHEVDRWPEFKRRYEVELRERSDVLEELLEHARSHRTTTFVYAARDEEHNSARVLRDFVERRLHAKAPSR